MAPFLGREHRRTWRSFFIGIAGARHDNEPLGTRWDLLRGFLKWVLGFFYRGYTSGNDVYLCPLGYATPTTWWTRLVDRATRALTQLDAEHLRAHEWGHVPTFAWRFPAHPGALTPPPRGEGLHHEPLESFDIMLPGYWSWFRFTDVRGIHRAYVEASNAGRFEVVYE